METALRFLPLTEGTHKIQVLNPIKPYVHFVVLSKLEKERFEEMARNGDGDLILDDCVYFDHVPFPVRVDNHQNRWFAEYVPWVGY